MIGKTIKGRYRICDQLGGEGTTTLYLARDLRSDEILTIRVFSGATSPSPEAANRFQRECQLLADLHDAHVLGVRDSGVEGQIAYVITEHVAGKNLTAFVRAFGRHMEIEVALHIAAQIAQGLSALHARRIICRNLNPDHVLVSLQGTTKIGGIPVQWPDGTALVGMDRLPISPYLAPEQLRGQTNERSDLYALGAILYTLLSGRPPITGTPLQLTMNIPAFTVARLSAQRADVPPLVDDIIQRCMAKNPTERPASALMLRNELSLLLPGTVVLERDPLLAQAVLRLVEASPPEPPAPSTPGVPHLRSLDGRTYLLSKEGVRIGRSDPAQGIVPDIDLKDAPNGRSVSRRHARMFRRHDQWYVIEERGVLNGTFVNGIRVSPERETPVNDGDELRFASVILIFHAM